MSEQILTEAELNKLEKYHKDDITNYEEVGKLIASHRTINSRNAKLVHENDGLMAENEMRKKYESFLKSVIRCRSALADDYDFERFERDMCPLKIELEELNHE